MAEAETGAGPGVEVALRRLVLGFRAVSVLWLALLAVIVALRGEDDLVVWSTTALAAGWTAATFTAARRPRLLHAWPWLAADLAVAGWTIIGPTVLAGPVEAFWGGYPFSSVILGVWARGLPGGLAAAAVLGAATLARLPLHGQPVLASGVEYVVFYLATAGVLDWSLKVLRGNEARRAAAEAALAAERAERMRSQERAETAAHLHDSVLQTLALIQRRSGDAAQVSGLARRQEHELRDWLRGGGLAAAENLSRALARLVAEIEDRYGLHVELVTVGDAALDGAHEALLAAAREALVNVAKHAGVAEAAVYAEASNGAVQVFVRDRGVGFDPAAVDPDRHGVRSSIIDRLARHGGSAVVRSARGGGTEVVLTLPAPEGS